VAVRWCRGGGSGGTPGPTARGWQLISLEGPAVGAAVAADVGAAVCIVGGAGVAVGLVGVAGAAGCVAVAAGVGVAGFVGAGSGFAGAGSGFAGAESGLGSAAEPAPLVLRWGGASLGGRSIAV